MFLLKVCALYDFQGKKGCWFATKTHHFFSLLRKKRNLQKSYDTGPLPLMIFQLAVSFSHEVCEFHPTVDHSFFYQ